MAQTLPEFLKRQAETSLAYILREAEAVSAEDALRGRRANWPDHRWGIGQNGSIAGIVFHVAAWKQMTLPLFQPGGAAQQRSEFDLSNALDTSDWPAIVSWLREVGTQWNTRLSAVVEPEFDTLLEWEGARITMTQFVVEMIQHDIQHAAQIEYLRQQYKSEAAR